MKLPSAYAWLENEKAPAILMQAIKLYGTAETPGPKSTPAIMQWAEEVGQAKLGIKYESDDLAWCGLFLAVCCMRAGLDVPNIAVRASQWATWGDYAEDAMLGDVLVFTRKGGGHVGLYVGEDNGFYHVLGGNQSDRVCITRIAKNRLSTARRTHWKVAQPKQVRKITLAANGAISENEA